MVCMARECEKWTSYSLQTRKLQSLTNDKIYYLALFGH